VAKGRAGVSRKDDNPGEIIVPINFHSQFSRISQAANVNTLQLFIQIVAKSQESPNTNNSLKWLGTTTKALCREE